MNIDSNFFDFEKLSNPIDQGTVFNYKGWSGLYAAKFILPKGKKIDSFSVDKFYPDLINKEKIFVTTEGNIHLKSDLIDKEFNKFDAVDFVSGNEKYSFISSEDTSFFMICASKSKIHKDKSFCFNFKKDIEARNLWGGQIISRPYEGKELTLVLFDLKPGFQFEDKGHINEQITWLTNGEMDFYANGIKKTLKTNIGVSIGANHVHGGISNGALGFDAFYPKRVEGKYKKN